MSPHLFSHKPYWAHRFGPAPVLPMSRAEMDDLGWDSCDIIIVTGDAYVDHPSFGMAIIGRLLESQGFRVGIISQPRWHNADDFKVLGKPNLYWGITAGNMDSMVNRYTADHKIRSDDAYTANDEGGKRPDRCVIVYSQRCKQAYKKVPVVIGGIEASLRRIAHYDYWSDKVRRSILVDSKADILLYGNAERALVELSHRLANREPISEIQDLRGTAFMRSSLPDDYPIMDSTSMDKVGKIDPPVNPYLKTTDTNGGCDKFEKPSASSASSGSAIALPLPTRRHCVIHLPAFEKVSKDAVLYAHTSRILHIESNHHNARPLAQQHGQRWVWLNPPPVPLKTEEFDGLFAFPYTRVPHPSYGEAKIPAYEMIKFSINIMRGCFGGCSFCSITEHEGRIIQSRSEDSIVKEIETIRDTVPSFKGNISDLGGPTANMYRLHCKDPKIESSCRRLSCVFPEICKNLGTDHAPLIRLYRRVRQLRGIKRVFIASGVRYDLAMESPEYVKELVMHHVGGYLKIAPEHTEDGVLDKMMKPSMKIYDRFKQMFEQFSKEAGKEQYLIPYFIAAHPATTNKDMLNLALWLKKNKFRLDQVQAFLPSPMALATTMYHSGKNPLKKVTRDSETVFSPKGLRQRRLHKAFLRYHDANNWPILREALKKMGRADLIGNGKNHLVPNYQPTNGRKPTTGKLHLARTHHPMRKKPYQKTQKRHRR